MKPKKPKSEARARIPFDYFGVRGVTFQVWRKDRAALMDWLKKELEQGHIFSYSICDGEGDDTLEVQLGA